jgi:predicted nucleotide-binding protein (sugar kinase/HSP70/actin superfamily)
LWADFFQRLGYEVALSSPSSPALFAKGLRKLPVETCLPIKITFGHVLDLAEQGVDYVFLPALRQLPSAEKVEGKAAPCLFTEHVPYMVKAVAPVEVLTPQLSLGEIVTSRELTGLAESLGVTSEEAKAAFAHAREDYKALTAPLEARGKEILAGTFGRAFVILGRPYNLYDPFQNLNLGRHLERLGVFTIPMGYLPLSEVQLGPEWDELL